MADGEEPEAEPDAEAPELGFTAATMKGFEELPPVPLGRSKEVVPLESCCLRLAPVSIEPIALPLL